MQRLKSIRVKVLHNFENNLYDSHFKENLKYKSLYYRCK